MECLADWFTEMVPYIGEQQLKLGSNSKDEEVIQMFKKVFIVVKKNSNYKLHLQIADLLVSFPSSSATPEYTGKICEILEYIFSQNAFNAMQPDHKAKFISWFCYGCEDRCNSSDNGTLLQLLSVLHDFFKINQSHSKKAYISLVGSSGVLTKVLENKQLSTSCHSYALTALHLLSYIPQEVLHYMKSTNVSIFPPEVISTMQRITLGYLKKLLVPSNYSEDQSSIAASCHSILYNLVICVPDEVLGGTVLNAAFPFVFYGLPQSKEVKFVEEESEMLIKVNQVSDSNSDSQTKSCANRNRRKRLRRMKPQPSKTTLDFSQVENASDVSLKPHWMGAPSGTKITKDNSVSKNKGPWRESPGSSSSEAGQGSVNQGPWTQVSCSPSENKQYSKNDTSWRNQYNSSPSGINNSKNQHSWRDHTESPSEIVKISEMHVPPKKFSNSSTENWRTSKTESNFASTTKPNASSKHESQNINQYQPTNFHSQSLSTDSPFSLNDLDDVTQFEKGTVKFSLIQAKVRKRALILINSIINNAGRQNKFSFWPQMMCKTPSLMSSALRDPSICVRMASLQVISTFLMDSKEVLKMAVDEKDTGSYSTLGRQLGASIRDLHRCLILCLISERVPNVLVRILKTFELLIDNINYANFKPGLLTKIVTHVKYFLRYKEAVVQASAFSVMVILLMKKPQIPELRDLLLKYQTPAPESLSRAPPVRAPSPWEEETPDLDEGIGEDSLLGYFDDSLTLSTSEDEATSDSNSESENCKTMVSWIIHRCVDSLLSHDGSVGQGMYVQVQLQALKVLNALVSEHIDLMKSSIPLIQYVITVFCSLYFPPTKQEVVISHVHSNSLEDAVASHDPALIVEHSFFLLASLLASIKHQMEGYTHETQDSHKTSIFTQQEALDIWLWALQGPLQPLLKLQEKTTLSQKPESETGENPPPCPILEIFPQKPLTAAANSISEICSSVLDSLGEAWKSEILGTVSFLLTHTEYELRLCGIQIISNIAKYSSIQEHVMGPTLIQTASRLSITILSSKKLHVNKDRILASWTLANISVHIISYKETWDQLQRGGSFFDSELLGGFLDSCILGCQDKDKIRPHAVRAIGNFVTYLFLVMKEGQQEVEAQIDKGINVLLESSITGNNMKMRWNACHAIGKLLANPDLDIERAPWRYSLITKLSHMVQQFKNFVVRIQSCITLCQIQTRSAYASEFIIVWKSFLKGLDNIGSVLDYKAMQHKEEFTYQICIGICHLTQLLELQDLNTLCELLSLYSDVVHESLKKSNERLTAEKASCFVKVSKQISKLEESDALTVDQQNSLDLLKKIFEL